MDTRDSLYYRDLRDSKCYQDIDCVNPIKSEKSGLGEKRFSRKKRGADSVSKGSEKSVTDEYSKLMDKKNHVKNVEGRFLCLSEYACLNISSFYISTANAFLCKESYVEIILEFKYPDESNTPVIKRGKGYLPENKDRIENEQKMEVKCSNIKL